jgi:hypothetical protein
MPPSYFVRATGLQPSQKSTATRSFSQDQAKRHPSDGRATDCRATILLSGRPVLNSILFAWNGLVLDRYCARNENFVRVWGATSGISRATPLVSLTSRSTTKVEGSRCGLLKRARSNAPRDDADCIALVELGAVLRRCQGRRSRQGPLSPDPLPSTIMFVIVEVLHASRARSDSARSPIPVLKHNLAK